jgi:hypothetical protein
MCSSFINTKKRLNQAFFIENVLLKIIRSTDKFSINVKYVHTYCTVTQLCIYCHILNESNICYVPYREFFFTPPPPREKYNQY